VNESKSQSSKGTPVPNTVQPSPVITPSPTGSPSPSLPGKRSKHKARNTLLFLGIAVILFFASFKLLKFEESPALFFGLAGAGTVIEIFSRLGQGWGMRRELKALLNRNPTASDFDAWLKRHFIRDFNSLDLRTASNFYLSLMAFLPIVLLLFYCIPWTPKGGWGQLSRVIVYFPLAIYLCRRLGVSVEKAWFSQVNAVKHKIKTSSAEVCTQVVNAWHEAESAAAWEAEKKRKAKRAEQERLQTIEAAIARWGEAVRARWEARTPTYYGDAEEVLLAMEVAADESRPTHERHWAFEYLGGSKSQIAREFLISELKRDPEGEWKITLLYAIAKSGSDDAADAIMQMFFHAKDSRDDLRMYEELLTPIATREILPKLLPAAAGTPPRHLARTARKIIENVVRRQVGDIPLDVLQSIVSLQPLCFYHEAVVGHEADGTLVFYDTGGESWLRSEELLSLASAELEKRGEKPATDGKTSQL
jgi:hypothetical protein